MLVFEAEPAFVIHKRPYRDNSSLVQFLTPSHGRITVVARLSSKLIGKTLQPFIPARLTCSGRGSLLNLRHFEPEGAGLLADTRRRMVGMYVNELVARLTPSASPSRRLFELYRECLQALAAAADASADETERALRHFELRLLDLTGNGLQLEHEHDTLKPVAADEDYHYRPGDGPERARAAAGRAVYRGETLIALRGEPRQWRREILPESKRLLRAVIDHHLHGNLQARRIFDYLKHLA
ncbi:MAG: DNA repair protein RecO [Gammaproteobacteria bacterium]|nr:DNA repair protein RecO [Gammaproteobacteria bacterium]MDD9868953.1 DNA repair protein RecO [Gammaproteobacteria bacterium]